MDGVTCRPSSIAAMLVFPTYLLVYRVLPPGLLLSLQRLCRFLHIVVQQAQLPRDEVRVLCIACPSGRVYDVQASVYQRAYGDQLLQDQCRRLRRGGYCEAIAFSSEIVTGLARYVQAWQSHVDSLGGRFNNAFQAARLDSSVVRTPLTMRVPALVTKPLTHSDLWVERARVEPFSVGASSAAHSSRPSLRDCRVSWRDNKSHSSSRAWRTVQHSAALTASSLSTTGCTLAAYQRCFLLSDQLIRGYRRPHGCGHGVIELGECSVHKPRDDCDDGLRLRSDACPGNRA